MRKTSFALFFGLALLVWGSLLVQAATVQITTLEAPEVQGSNAATFWQIDYWDTDGKGTGFDPSSSFTAHPSSLSGGFNPSSLRMATGNGEGGAGCTRLGGRTFFGSQDLNGMRAGDIGDLSYSTLVDSTSGDAGSNLLSTNVNIFVDLNNDGVWSAGVDSILIADPLYSPSAAGSPTAHAVNGAFVQDSWYTFNPGPGGTGEWHTSTGAASIPGIAVATPSGAARTWNQIMAVPIAFPGYPAGSTVADLEIVNPNASGCGVHGDEGTQSGLAFVVGQKNGIAWNDYVGFLDNITFSHSGAAITTTTYDLTADPWVLAFTTQPSDADPGASIAPDIVVEIQDASGNVVTGATNNVSLAINANPGAGTLAGTVSVAAVNGVATFSGLSINNAGIGYTLDASATGLTADTSATFNINTASIGVAKTAAIVGTGPWTVTLSLLVENLGNSTLSNVQVTEALATFGVAGVDWTLGSVNVSSANASVLVNPAYDGNADMNLLSAGASIDAGQTISITITLVVNTAGTYSNQVTTQGFVGATVYTDISDDGLDPDPDGDAVANEAGENDPTPIVLTSPVVPPITGGGTSTGGNLAQPQIGVFDPAISKLGLLLPGQTGVVGEKLEWLVTVSNTSAVAGTNVTITDTLIPAMQIDSVDAVAGNVTISGQTVTVVYPTLAVGQTVQFSIFTTVLSGATIENTACVNAANQGAQECALGLPVSELPTTGESPLWRIWLISALALSSLGLLWIVANRRMKAKP